MPTQPDVIVIGAGVIGLSTALQLQSQYSSISVKIVAAELPAVPPFTNAQNISEEKVKDFLTNVSADYASMWAGAHYRPIPGSSQQLVREREMAFRTAQKMQMIAKSNPEAGVKIIPAEEYLEDVPDANIVLRSGDLYAGPNDEFTVLEKRDLPAGIAWGCKYQAWIVNVHVYCGWLLGRFLANGGQVLRRRLSSLDEVFLPFQAKQQPLVINCSGRNFDQDPKMQFIRGQTVLVKNQYHKTVTRQNRDGSWSFLIPRPLGEGTIVGGTKEIGDIETQPRPESRKRLLQMAATHFPDFVAKVDDFEVVMDNVGRRPWRDGGMRIEAEELKDGRRVIHAYGAGGRGYELSWGAAEEAVRLTSRYLSSERLRSKL